MYNAIGNNNNNNRSVMPLNACIEPLNYCQLPIGKWLANWPAIRGDIYGQMWLLIMQASTQWLRQIWDMASVEGVQILCKLYKLRKTSGTTEKINGVLEKWHHVVFSENNLNFILAIIIVLFNFKGLQWVWFYF